MEDRQAKRFRPLGEGIPAQPIGAIPVGVSERPLEDGILQGVESATGIPAGPGFGNKPEEGPAKCTSTTKKGDPCKAYATASGKLCVGHGG